MGKKFAGIAMFLVGLWFIIGILLFLLKILSIVSISWIAIITFLTIPYVLSLTIVGVAYLILKIKMLFTKWNIKKK